MLAHQSRSCTHTHATASKASCLPTAKRCIGIGVSSITKAMRLVQSMCRDTAADLLAGNSVWSTVFIIVEHALAVLFFEPRIAKGILCWQVCVSDVIAPLIFGICTKPTKIAKLKEVQHAALARKCVFHQSCFGNTQRRARMHLASPHHYDRDLIRLYAFRVHVARDGLRLQTLSRLLVRHGRGNT